MVLAASVLSAATLPQAQNLLQLGLYAGAQEAFKEIQARQPSTAAAQGLLQSLLVQGKAAEASLELNALPENILNTDQRKLYAALGVTSTEPLEVNLANLDPVEAAWAQYYVGLQAFAAGNYTQAEASWKSLSADDSPYWLKVALTRQATAETTELEKHLKKMRRQDWPLVRNYLLGMVVRGQAVEARGFIDSNVARLPTFQAGLIRAITYPEKTPQRAEALMGLLPAAPVGSDTNIVVMLALNEPTLGLSDIEQQLGERKKEAPTALILAQAWLQKGSVGRAYDLLGGVSVERLGADWRAAYYSTLGHAAANLQPARYREAANALQKWRELPSTTAQEAQLIDRQIADAYYKNADYADAAGVYEKNLRFDGLPAVLSWLALGKTAQAQRLLQQRPVFEQWDQAVLAYLLEVRKQKGDLEEAYTALGADLPSKLQSWPIEYLRIVDAEEKSPGTALKMLQSLPAMQDPAGSLFELKEYQLLLRLGEGAKANALLERVMARPSLAREWVSPLLARALANQKPAEAISLLTKAKDISPSDRVNIMFLVASQMGNEAAELEKIQEAIVQLPAAERPTKMLMLGQRWAQIGRLSQARATLEALQESSLQTDLRSELEFLGATISEMEGDALAENQWLALSQRSTAGVRLRALARLGAYYAQHGQPAKAKEIFYKDLAGLMMQWPEDLQSSRQEVLKAMTVLSAILPTTDANSVLDWVAGRSFDAVSP